MHHIIIDICFGWDPADAVALLLAVKHQKMTKRKTRLCILTNCEVSNPYGHERARLVTKFLQLFPFVKDIPIYTGCPEAHKVPQSRMLPVISDLYEVIDGSTGTFKDIDALLCELRETDRVHDILWISTRSMTNIRYALEKGRLPLDRLKIVQAGGSCESSNFNVLLDVAACQSIISACKDKHVPILFVMDDVLSDVPGMLLVNGMNHVFNDPWASLLEKYHPEALEFLKIGLGGHHTDFSGASTMLGPLTVIYAFTQYSDISRSYLFPVCPASINCKRNGRWLITIDFAELYVEGGVFNKDFPQYAEERSAWWSNKITHFSGMKSGQSLDGFPVTVSFGPLCRANREIFFNIFEWLLAYQSVSQVFVSASVDYAVTNIVSQQKRPSFFDMTELIATKSK